VEEELEDGHTPQGEDPLEIVDDLVAGAPNLFGHEVLYPHDEHVLVVGAVEDADAPLGRRALVVAPQEVVVGLLRRGGLERGNPAALGVDSLEDVLDRAVLPAGVHRLQDDQTSLPVLGVQTLLQVPDALALRLEVAADVLFCAVMLRLARVHVREPKLRAGLDPVARVVRLRR
jgi:hypothetical protein